MGLRGALISRSKSGDIVVESEYFVLPSEENTIPKHTQQSIREIVGMILSLMVKFDLMTTDVFGLG